MRRFLPYTVEKFQKLCYHNRKSQQVLLMEKLKMKNVIHVFGVSGSGTTMARFCLSAFVRVATLVVFAREPMIDLCHSAFVRVATAEKQCSALRICCEKVDSFSSVGESGLALTIFPFSFAAKATYVAINDSFGRAIDRFFWCEPHRN